MPDPKIDPVFLNHEIKERLDRLAVASGLSPDAILREAVTQYLDREENPSARKYPQRTPVGGIITPM
jgi:hypothetical protein